MGVFSKLNQNTAKDSAVDNKEEQKDVQNDAVDAAALRDTGMAYHVLVRPIISEKSTLLATQGQYTFEVAWDANKQMVKDAIYRVYGVRPVRVNLIAMKGKAVTFKRIRGKRKDWKKAIVFMPKGQKIEVFEGV